jgi:hypothetical protein
MKPLFHLSDIGKISLKNSAERTYFSSATEYVDDLKRAFDKYDQKKERYEEAEVILAKQIAPAVILEIEEKIQKVEEEMKEIETKISKTIRKEAHEGEGEGMRSELLDKMTVCVNYNSQASIPVVITDLNDIIS